MEAIQSEAAISSTPHFDRWNRLRESALWTPAVRAFAKKADLAVIYFDEVPDAPSYHRDAKFVKMKLVQEARLGRKEEVTMEVDFTGHIGTGYLDDLREASGPYSWTEYSREDSNLYRPTQGTWLLHLYPGQATHAHSCLMSIPTNSKMHFRVRLDYHTSPLLAEARLHGDILELTAEKGKQRLGFNLDTQTVHQNSARFGHYNG